MTTDRTDRADRTADSAHDRTPRWGAWEVREANWAAIGMMLAAGAAMLMDELLVDYSGAAQIWNLVFPAVLFGGPLGLIRFGHRLPPIFFLGLAIACGMMLTGMSWAKQDAGAATLLTSGLPVIYGGATLGPRGSYLLLLYAVLSDALLLFAFTPHPQALRILGYLVVTQVICSVVLTRSGTARRRLARQLAAQADVDPLTGLVTRRVLDEAAQSAMAAGRHRDGVALLLIDVDHFKTINDTYGHPAGDAALQHLAEVLAENMRPDAVIGRLGGDELAVLLPGCDATVAQARAEQLVRAVRDNPLRLPAGTGPERPGTDPDEATVLHLSVSIGVAHAPATESTESRESRESCAAADTGDLMHLYAGADAALYRAKRAGRGQVG